MSDTWEWWWIVSHKWHVRFSPSFLSDLLCWHFRYNYIKLRVKNYLITEAYVHARAQSSGKDKRKYTRIWREFRWQSHPSCAFLFSLHGVHAGKFNFVFAYYIAGFIFLLHASMRAWCWTMDFHWCDSANDEHTVDFASLPMSVSVKQYSTSKYTLFEARQNQQ